MGTPSAGAVVVVPFPFSDLSQTKLRPVLSILADVGRGDWVLCQITSNPYGDIHAIPLAEDDFSVGSLHVRSYARPGKLFTASSDLVVGEVGRLQRLAFRRVIDGVVSLFRAAEAHVAQGA